MCFSTNFEATKHKKKKWKKWKKKGIQDFSQLFAIWNTLGCYYQQLKGVPENHFFFFFPPHPLGGSIMLLLTLPSCVTRILNLQVDGEMLNHLQQQQQHIPIKIPQSGDWGGQSDVERLFSTDPRFKIIPTYKKSIFLMFIYMYVRTPWWKNSSSATGY